MFDQGSIMDYWFIQKLETRCSELKTQLRRAEEKTKVHDVLFKMACVILTLLVSGIGG